MGYCGAEWEAAPLLLGESVQKLDAKNRVTLPAKLRQHFAVPLHEMLERAEVERLRVHVALPAVANLPHLGP